MGSIKIKRAYDRPGPRDGKRILIDRLWPRGLRKDTASIDLWNKEIAPTPALRRWFDHRADRFTEFKCRYRDELKSKHAAVENLRQVARGRTTLVYAARDRAVNHAVVLAEFLTKGQRRKLAAKKFKKIRSERRRRASRTTEAFVCRSGLRAASDTIVQ